MPSREQFLDAFYLCDNDDDLKLGNAHQSVGTHQACFHRDKANARPSLDTPYHFLLT
jgi:hypothetical protein